MKEYSFDDNGNLLPQRIRRCHLAFFYGVTPRQFRRELDDIMYVEPFRRYYSVKEVEMILKHLGQVTEADVHNAQKEIDNYLAKEKARLSKY